MSTDNEREIRGRLDAALGTIDPPGPPVNAVLRRGRNIRLRRRAAVAAGLAAVVGLGIALPGLVGHVRAAPTLQHSYRVTQNPVRETPGKLTFSGTINGRPWLFNLVWERGNVAESGPGASIVQLGDLGTGGEPGLLIAEGSGTQLLAGRLRSDIRSVALDEPGGRVIHLSPVRWHGQLWAGVEIKGRPALREVVAYSAGREVAYAVPFRDNEINLWLAPGQRGLARRTVRIAEGTIGGKRWSLTGYAGPWGICFRGTDTGACSPAYTTSLPRGERLRWLTCGPVIDPAGQLWSGQAASDVSSLRFRMPDGSVLRVAPVTLAGNRFFAVIFSAHLRITGWTAFGASGQVLGSGSVSWKC